MATGIAQEGGCCSGHKDFEPVLRPGSGFPSLYHLSLPFFLSSSQKRFFHFTMVTEVSLTPHANNQNSLC